MFRPTLGHHQVVLTSLKNTVHEVEVVYSDDEISFILHISRYLLGLKVVFAVFRLKVIAYCTLIYSARDIRHISKAILQFSRSVFCYFVANF